MDDASQSASLHQEPLKDFDPRQRKLAVLSCRLAWACPLAICWLVLSYSRSDIHSSTYLFTRLVWWMACFCSLLGGILGASVLFRFWRGAPGARKMRANYALAGLLIGLPAVLLWPVGDFLLHELSYNFGFWREQNSSNCISHIRTMWVAMRIYNEDYDDHYPPADTWNETLLVGNYRTNPATFHCPERPGGEHATTYAMSSALPKVLASSITVPEQTVMLFDSLPGKSPVGGRGLLPVPGRHEGLNTIGFVDGHVKQFSADQIADLVWTPHTTTSHQ